MDKSTFCHMPFNSLEVSPDGTCQVCCKIKKRITKETGQNYNLKSDSLNEIWNSNDLKILRNKFLNGEKPSECELCWIEESSGNISLRHHSFEIPRSEKTGVEYLVLKLSNLCNLKCRICSPDLSTQWLSEAIENNWIQADQIAQLNEHRSAKLNAENFQTLQLWLPHLKRLLAYGGEPFLSLELKKVLHTCVEKNFAKNIVFTANTNGTVCNTEVLGMISEFKEAHILFSIDDTGQRFEFQRKNARWDLVNENLKKFSNLPTHIKLGFFPTLSVLNIFSLHEYLEWTLNYPTFFVTIENTLHTPHELSLRNASQAMKQEMITSLRTIDLSKYNVSNKNALQVIQAFISLPPNDTQLSDQDRRQRSHQFLTHVDRARGESYQSTFPELQKFLSTAALN